MKSRNSYPLIINSSQLVYIAQKVLTYLFDRHLYNARERQTELIEYLLGQKSQMDTMPPSAKKSEMIAVQDRLMVLANNWKQADISKIMYNEKLMVAHFHDQIFQLNIVYDLSLQKAQRIKYDFDKHRTAADIATNPMITVRLHKVTSRNNLYIDDFYRYFNQQTATIEATLPTEAFNQQYVSSSMSLLTETQPGVPIFNSFPAEVIDKNKLVTLCLITLAASGEFENKPAERAKLVENLLISQARLMLKINLDPLVKSEWTSLSYKLLDIVHDWNIDFLSKHNKNSAKINPRNLKRMFYSFLKKHNVLISTQPSNNIAIIHIQKFPLNATKHDSYIKAFSQQFLGREWTGKLSVRINNASQKSDHRIRVDHINDESSDATAETMDFAEYAMQAPNSAVAITVSTNPSTLYYQKKRSATSAYLTPIDPKRYIWEDSTELSVDDLSDDLSESVKPSATDSEMPLSLPTLSDDTDRSYLAINKSLRS